MNFRTLQLSNFRSYRQRKFDFNPGLNLIVGKNGSGKTNLLEALYVLAVGKSFRAKDQQLIRHGAQGYRLAAELSGGPKLSLRYLGQSRSKTLELSGKPVKPEGYLGAAQDIINKMLNGAHLSGTVQILLVSDKPNEISPLLNASIQIS